MPEQKQFTIPAELSVMDKKQVEKDVREMIGAEEEDVPVILDLESIRIAGPGKFEIDVVNLLDKNRPLIYKLDEGKYVIDLASTLKVNLNEIHKKIKKPIIIRKTKEVKNGEEKQKEQQEKKQQ